MENFVLLPITLPTKVESSDPKLTEQASLVTDQGLDDASGENAEEGLETVDPVRLRDGGLLFSSDPELPRKNL